MQIIFNEKYQDPSLRPTVPNFIVKGYISDAQLSLADKLIDSVQQAYYRELIDAGKQNPTTYGVVAANPHIEAALLNICKSPHGGLVALRVGEKNPVWRHLVALLKQPNVYFPHNSWFQQNDHLVKDVVREAKRLA